MKPFNLLLIAALAAVAVSKEDISQEKFDEHYGQDGHDHNVAFDQQVILGSRELRKEFEKLEPTEAKMRLDLMVKKMDSNGDKYVDKDELAQWVKKSFTKLDEEDAMDKFKEQDANEDGKVSWDEYLQAVYNFKKEELVDMDKDKNPQMQQYADMVKDDLLRFNMADENKDGDLQTDEYYAFAHPWNYNHMHILEIRNAYKDHDKNKDGFIDLKEYLGDSDREKEIEIVDIENFHAFDSDGDGKLDQGEVKTWMIPDYDSAAEDEAKHLIEHSDLDGDGKLLRQEILDKHEIWVGSSATDYGKLLHEEL